MTQKELKEKALNFVNSGGDSAAIYMNVPGTPFYYGRVDASKGAKFKPRWMPGGANPDSKLNRYQKDMMECQLVEYAVGFFTNTGDAK